MGAQPRQTIPRGREGIHEKVLAYLAEKPRGKVLDIPTGYGALAKRLVDLQFDVTCCDIDPTQFSVDELAVDRGDLNARIPYGDRQFDYVCFLEGIEHTENPYNAVREVSRVLKPGGTLIMTTPNYVNIERRLKFLVTGSFTKPVSQHAFREKYRGKITEMHLTPLGFTLLKFALEHARLRITEISTGKKKRRQVFLRPLVWLIRVYNRLWPEDARERYWISETSSDAILGGGDTLFIFAQKV
ncbi:MAG: class I SAM-dependent methyltransferase [Candidatus Methylomirabilales bacterium]